jgi:hypothetical protein
MQRWLVLALAPAAAALLPSPLARSRGVVRLARAAAPRLAARFAVGVDVGTGSARAGVVDVSTGELCGVHKQDILLFNPLPDFYEQSSDDIWSAVCTCVKGALAAAGASPDDVCGVAFDATCSLVVLDGEGQPVGVDPTVPDDAARNVIVWMDHRAEEQVAATIKALHTACVHTIMDTRTGVLLALTRILNGAAQPQRPDFEGWPRRLALVLRLIPAPLVAALSCEASP